MSWPYITDPRGRHESDHLTEQGMTFAKRIAGELFGRTCRHESESW